MPCRLGNSKAAKAPAQGENPDQAHYFPCPRQAAGFDLYKVINNLGPGYLKDRPLPCTERCWGGSLGST